MAAKDPSRYAIRGVAVVERHGDTYLAATDGKALTLVRAYPDDADDMPSMAQRIYPVPAFAAARKAGKRLPDAALTLNGAAYVDGADGSHVEFPKVDGTFPDVGSVMPKGSGELLVRLDAEYLARMQKALGASGVEIRSHGEGMPLTIVPIYCAGDGKADGSVGLLMPIGGGK